MMAPIARGGEGRMARVFFVSRAFPPVVGGIEKHNFELLTMLACRLPVSAVINTKGKKMLPVFFVVALIRLLWLARKGDVLILGDGVLAPLGWLVRAVRKVRVVAIIHGLDVTYPSWVYQRFWAKYFIASLDVLVAVSRSTKDEVTRRIDTGIDIRIIPNGIDINSLAHDPGAAHATSFDDFPNGRIILLTIGRLVRRKGVEWFVREVMPRLPDNFHYLVAGKGDERAAIQSAIDENGLGARVQLVGEVSEREKAFLLKRADYFVQPNIVVQGDVEGFGITVIEAGVNGLMVIAADLQGLKDSVLPGRTGILLPPESPGDWIDYLTKHPVPEFSRSEVEAATKAAFSWDVIIENYMSIIKEQQKKGGD